MAETTLHPLIQLLCKRMVSHPEEFTDVWGGVNVPVRDVEANIWDSDRWGRILERIQEWTTPEEKEAIHAGMRIIMMGRLHDLAMDELLNGEDRRREEKRQYALDVVQKQKQNIVQLNQLQAAQAQAAIAQAQVQVPPYAQGLMNHNPYGQVLGNNSIAQLPVPAISPETQKLTAKAIRQLNDLLGNRTP